MTDILATIDNALDDCSVSDDAMRWTPEPPKFRRFTLGTWTPPIVVLDVAFIERLGIEVAQWQEAMIRAFDAAAKAVAPAFARVSESFVALEPVLRRVEAERRARLRHMRHLYRQRRRKW